MIIPGISRPVRPLIWPKFMLKVSFLTSDHITTHAKLRLSQEMLRMFAANI